MLKLEKKDTLLGKKVVLYPADCVGGRIAEKVLPSIIAMIPAKTHLDGAPEGVTSTP